jgi:hypothetical protein
LQRGKSRVRRGNQFVAAILASKVKDTNVFGHGY